MNLPDKAQRLDTQRLFENLFASSPDAIVVVDREGCILEANPQIESIFGYTCSELLGRPVEILIPDRFRSVYATYRSEFAEQPRMRPMGTDRELYGRRKNGNEFPADICCMRHLRRKQSGSSVPIALPPCFYLTSMA